MKFQEDISNMNTYIRTSRNQYVPHFFKVGGIKNVCVGGGGGEGAIFEPKTLSMYLKKEKEKKVKKKKKKKN